MCISKLFAHKKSTGAETYGMRYRHNIYIYTYAGPMVHDYVASFPTWQLILYTVPTGLESRKLFSFAKTIHLMCISILPSLDAVPYM